MARSPRNQEASDELAAALSERYDLLPHPKPTWPGIARHIAVTSAGRIQVSDETVKKMHLGLVDPSTTNPDHLLAIVDFYNLNPLPMKIADLGPTAEGRLSNLLELVQKLKKMNGARRSASRGMAAA